MKEYMTLNFHFWIIICHLNPASEMLLAGKSGLSAPVGNLLMM